MQASAVREQPEHHHPQMLIKFKKEKSLDRSVNIFESATEDDKNPSLAERDFQRKRYSVVGDRLFVDKMMERLSQDSISKQDHHPTPNVPSLELSSHTNEYEMTSEGMHTRLMNTTYNQSLFQSKLLSKLSKQEQLSYTREKRNIELFKARQQYWKNSPEQGKVRARSQNLKKPILEPVIESSRIYVQPNPNQQQAILNNPTGYWRKSLRNNDKELLKYIEGVPYDKVELQKLLQTEGGIQKIESKVPVLDLNIVRETEKAGGLVLSARSKGKSEFEACHSFGTSIYRTERYPEHFEEVYKVEWNRRDLARRNLPMLPKMQLKQFS